MLDIWNAAAGVMFSLHDYVLINIILSPLPLVVVQNKLDEKSFRTQQGAMAQAQVRHGIQILKVV